jgi:excisionase family DNA binding protein
MTATSQPIPKICQQCKKPFTARKYTTKYCSLRCGQVAYKERERDAKYVRTQEQNHATLQSAVQENKEQGLRPHERALITIQMLAFLTDFSERHLYRMIKQKGFPKVKVGRSLRFHRETTIAYIQQHFAK